MHAPSDSEFCHNCGIRLNGRFCSACGQEALPLNVTVRDVFRDFVGETLNVDGQITFITSSLRSHVHAAWFAAASAAAAFELPSSLAGEVLQSTLVLYMPIYAMLALKHVYGNVRWSFTRRLVVVGIYGVAVIAAVLAIVLPVAFGRVLGPKT